MSRRQRRGRVKATKQISRVEGSDTSPLQERYKSYHHDGQWLGSGIKPIDVAVLTGGQISGSAYINRLEATALDGLEQAGVLRDNRDEEASFRRHMAGLLLRTIFQKSGIETSQSASYDKTLNEMLPGGTPAPQSDNELDHEVEFTRLMRLAFPFNTVLLNVCCLNERPPLVVRNGARVLCNWDEALRKGLDRIAEDKFANQQKPQRSTIRATTDGLSGLKETVGQEA